MVIVKGLKCNQVMVHDNCFILFPLSLKNWTIASVARLVTCGHLWTARMVSTGGEEERSSSSPWSRDSKGISKPALIQPTF